MLIRGGSFICKVRVLKPLLGSFSTIFSQKFGKIYIKSTRKNIFCTLIDIKDKKVKTSWSLRVPNYENEFNERENLFDRGMILGQLFGDKVIELGYKEVFIYLNSDINQGRDGVLTGLGQKIKISFIQLAKTLSHNGCRPAKMRRKKVRTRYRK